MKNLPTLMFRYIQNKTSRISIHIAQQPQQATVEWRNHMVHHLSLKRMKKLAVKSLHLIIKRMIRPRAFQGQHHIRYPRKTSVAKTQQNQTLCNLARFPDYKQFFLLCFRRFLGFFTPAQILPFSPKRRGGKGKFRQEQKKNQNSFKNGKYNCGFSY